VREKLEMRKCSADDSVPVLSHLPFFYIYGHALFCCYDYYLVLEMKLKRGGEREEEEEALPYVICSVVTMEKWREYILYWEIILMSWWRMERKTQREREERGEEERLECVK